MTRTLPFTQVDAFSDSRFTGNPAAVMPLDTWLPDDVMQAIAEENNLAETAFTVPLAPGEGADYGLRWFTPAVEVALCGHATLAAGHVLIGDRDRVTFRTVKAGDLTVARSDDGLALTLPDWGAMATPLPEIAAVMGGSIVETLWREGGYAVLVYPDAAAIRALEPDFAALKALGSHLFICTAPGDDTDVISRAFAPGAGIDEDPVTGSAHCVIAAYWADRLGRAEFTAFQASARGGFLKVRRTGDGSVTLTGRCRSVVRGEFLL